MTELVINLNELNLWELFEIRQQQTRDRVKRAVRLAISFEINMYSPVRKDKPAIACKAIQHETQSLVSFYIAGSLEKLIEHGSDTIF